MMLELLRVVPLLFLFFYLAIQDYRKGHVQNLVFVPFFVSGLLLTSTALVLDPSLILQSCLVAGFAILFGTMLYHVGAWGGADLKALIVLEVTLPTLPGASPLALIGLTTLLFGSLLAIAYGLARRQIKIRFLPSMFAGLVLALMFFMLLG